MSNSGQRWIVKNEFQLNALTEFIKLEWLKGKTPLFQVIKADRSTNQNSMINALYGQIAAQRDDLSVNDVRAHCKLHYGVPILRAYDPEFADMWDTRFLGDKMNYEDKLTLMTYLGVTRHFKKDQASEYIDTIIREYTKQGFALANPNQKSTAA